MNIDSKASRALVEYLEAEDDYEAAKRLVEQATIALAEAACRVAGIAPNQSVTVVIDENLVEVEYIHSSNNYTIRLESIDVVEGEDQPRRVSG